MTEKPTLSTVAKAAGVSIPTVSQVLRGTGRISKHTRDKVLQAAKVLRYVPDSRAAAMRSGENREVGFVINQLKNPFNAEVIGGAVDLLEAEGYLVSIVDTRDDAGRQSRQLEAFIRHGRGGMLWVPAMDTPEDSFELLAAHGVPTVTFLRRISNRLDHVGIRNAEATAVATAYLADLGHRHIAYLGGTEMTIVRKERIAGYHRVRMERGLAPGIVWDSEDNKLAGLDAMLALRATHPEVTAIVCNGDMVALGASLALYRVGLKPGQDISIIGFDDIQDAEVATPPLTTMAVSPYKLGRKLASVLLDRILEPDMPITVSEVSAELIVRQTTGAPPSRT
ncbi:LacI family DNA-binding transcriptional regulator [Shinella sp. 838]|uniref:LacI family DNA-binding transcriptional regulator n=1 Tax=Shinella sp. 838 TaxID=3038164 RepID=UPI002414F263|nr:LacI family DNA-binding transcriptional regulator [Shinella sp. 838]MDG4674951.1 LacI family DNA-binding transcriptional regulator [Shinella sp. 838]